MYLIGDPEAELNRRQNVANGTNRLTLQLLQETLHEVNHYIQQFKYVLETDDKIDEPGKRVVIKADKHTNRYHKGTLNAPQEMDFAAIVSDEHAEGKCRDIQIYPRGGPLQTIHELHKSYDPLQYPVILPNGQNGFDLKLKEERKRAKQPVITTCQFYAYQIQVRENDFNTLHKLGMLFSQFCVDAYARIESERLLWFKQPENQKTLRAAEYKGLLDALQENVSPQQIGTPMVLGPSFIGGPRYMHQKTQDAMTYVRVYGKPHLFITMTCDPKWEEIQRELFPGQISNDREDLIARVFEQKRRTLIDAITKHNLFGPCVAYMLSIEWQKRGLPHQHMLVWLADDIHPRTIDKVISAEFPDPETDPDLFSLVKKWMLHGPCGKRCQDESGNCSKKFPRPFTKETQTDQDGYPLYRRRKLGDGGQEISITRDSGAIHVYNNSHVVPYNPLLLRILKCHINVEYVASINAIKYVCKYVNKGTQ